VPRHLTALTALEYYGHLSNLPSRTIRERRGPLLEKVGLAARAKDPVRTYSKGMLQRLGLAQAMLHDPDLFILDEPTDGLDPLARSQVRGYLLDLKRQGKTIFLNSHILQEVELVCDRVAILDKGNLKRVANVAEITSGRGGQGAFAAGGIVAGGGVAGGNDSGDNGQPGQPAEALELHLDLTGPEPTIRETLNGLPISTWQPFGPTDHRVVARVPDQTTVDQLIDRLRSSGVSIVGLTRRRVSLEEAYLEIVSAETVD
jgi:ABC-2 type transport system ATP-binding protein